MRALISVFDKENILDFAKELEKMDWEIVSTGGTYKLLKDNGLKVISIDEVTKFPEILDGRVKTLNPLIHGGILFRREEPSHVKTIEEQGITPIDMVVNNLYPFEEALKAKKDHPTMIENIDIGGPSMIRAAAKNYRDVLIVTDPKDYEKTLEEIKKGPSIEFKEYLARKAFTLTAHYDTLISNYFEKRTDEKFPEYINKSYKLNEVLRYGENPHQGAAFYEDTDIEYKAPYEQLNGKQISYNNLNDMFGAIKIAKNFDPKDGAVAVAVKHTNPCGIGFGDTLKEAFKKAYDCDDESIFGGIIAMNREVDAATAKLLHEIFLEIVVAPAFTEEALEILCSKPNLRVLRLPSFNDFKFPALGQKDVLNGIIVQEYDTVDLKEEDLNFVTKERPTPEEMEELKFAWKCVKGSASNSVVITKNKGTIGIGQGQTKRSWAVEEAIERSGDKIKGAVMASDGFFFEDTMELLYKAGVHAVMQPGGSKSDPDVIKFADEHNMAVVFTGIRHFRH